MTETREWGRNPASSRGVTDVLDALPVEYVVMHDLTIPDSRTTLGHVVITANGVYVVDEICSAPVQTFADGMMQRGPQPIRRECDAVAWMATRLAIVLGVPVHPMLCSMTGGLPQPTQQIGTVTLCDHAALEDVISQGRDPMTPGDIRAIQECITHTLTAPTPPVLPPSGALVTRLASTVAVVRRPWRRGPRHIRARFRHMLMPGGNRSTKATISDAISGPRSS